jgi:putative cardiolipin synthase
MAGGRAWQAMKGWIGWLAMGVCAGLAACVGLPPPVPLEPAQAVVDTGDTPLARVAADSRPAHESDPSGFRLLPRGENAFSARLALARWAVRGIDAQYYHVHADGAGTAFLGSLRDAALRGVRVRLLVDDFYSGAIQELLLGLAAHPNVQVRLFNPLPARTGPPLVRLALSWPEFERVNHRMHNKLFIADNAMAIYGGRNVGDEYFMRHGEANFVDVDVLSTGAVVHDLSRAFDLYWNSEHVHPLEQVAHPGGDATDARAAFDARLRALPASIGAEPARDMLGQAPVAAELQEGRVRLQYGSARVMPDPPAKVRVPAAGRQPSAAMQGQLDAIAAAQSDVVISSPYFLPSDFGMRVLRGALARGNQVLVLTNSFGSTDEPLAHLAYAGYRPDLLRMGVELYEFGATLARESGGFGRFGDSIGRLHAKLAVVDRRWLLVGSVNLDSRSALYNTELAVAIDCPPVAIAALRVVAGDAFRSMYRLRLAVDGQAIEWISIGPDGEPVVTGKEPERHWLPSLPLWMQSLLVSEELL